MDPIFEILENSGNPTIQIHRSKWSQVEADLRRSGLCLACGTNSTVQRTMLGIKPKAGHRCYRENLCIPCYEYERGRNASPVVSKQKSLTALFVSGIDAAKKSPTPEQSRKRRFGVRHSKFDRTPLPA